MSKFSLTLMTLFTLASVYSTAGEKEPYFSDTLPKLEDKEFRKVYKQKFLSCEEINGPVKHACFAYGVLGMRLCYVKMGSRYLIAENDFLSHMNAYNGNDCMERFRLIDSICDKGYQSSKFQSMTCINKKFN